MIQPKTFLTLKIASRHVYAWCQRKHLHCTISWRPRTVFSKYFESKCLYISIYLRKKYFSQIRSNILIDGGELEEGWMIPEGNSLFRSPKMFYNFSFWLNFFKIQLIFRILILPSIALKRWKFPDKLDYKVKIVAKFLIRSHFLTI